VRTPNFPGYVSRHSTTSAAAADALRRLPRPRTTLAQDGDGGRLLRLLGGIHIRANDEATGAGAVSRVASATPWSR
jgi:hypothetical protein